MSQRECELHQLGLELKAGLIWINIYRPRTEATAEEMLSAYMKVRNLVGMNGYVFTWLRKAKLSTFKTNY